MVGRKNALRGASVREGKKLTGHDDVGRTRIPRVLSMGAMQKVSHGHKTVCYFTC